VGVASSAAPDDARAEREAAAARPDRSQRTQSSPAEDGAPRASDPEESPEPTPSEPAEPAESEPEPEPAQPEQASQAAPEADWVHPLPGASTTSCYGMRWGALHAGVDLAAPNGAPIRAVGDGVVTEVGWVYGGYGISVAIDHQNGFYTHYAHAAQANVSVGQRVSAGQTIALEGSTGDSTGPHLHFEVHQGWWNQIEPTSWMRDRGVDIGGC
jgi:murein DD-endopeptidase MepM/ murein hydrolase activator NlpD